MIMTIYTVEDMNLSVVALIDTENPLNTITIDGFKVVRKDTRSVNNEITRLGKELLKIEDCLGRMDFSEFSDTEGMKALYETVEFLTTRKASFETMLIQEVLTSIKTGGGEYESFTES